MENKWAPPSVALARWGLQTDRTEGLGSAGPKEPLGEETTGLDSTKPPWSGESSITSGSGREDPPVLGRPIFHGCAGSLIRSRVAYRLFLLVSSDKRMISSATFDGDGLQQMV